MALKVELKPGERIILGECVITNADQRTRLVIEGQMPILREKDILTPELADTPAKRIYLAVQLMYTSRDPRSHHEVYFALVRDILEGTVAKQIANPRELEANLLLKAAARLQAIRDAWDRGKPDLDDALLYNRKLWSIFLTSVTSPEHPLPVAIRQNIANLGLFVMNQTVSMMTNPRREQLESLININRELAAGLLGR